MGDNAATPELAFGTFFGREKRKTDTGGFCLSLSEPEAGGNQLPEHSHTEAHFIFPIRGKYVSTARGYVGENSVPMLIYSPPAVVHRDRFASSQGLFLGVSVTNERFFSLQPCGLPDYPIALQTGQLSHLVSALRKESQFEDHSSSIILEGLCLEIFGNIARGKTLANHGHPAWIDRAVECLSASVEKEITIRQLSMVLSVPELELLREFKRSQGCSPGRFLRNRRMEKARTMLQSSDSTLADVALSTGFSDQSAFTKAFSREHGISPGAFRARVRQTARSHGSQSRVSQQELT